jgi:hypothetical protein
MFEHAAILEKQQFEQRSVKRHINESSEIAKLN